MFLRLHDGLNSFIGVIDSILVVTTLMCLGVIVTIGGMEIFSRYVLDHSLFFVYEITMLLANWLYFLGFCLVFKRNEDIEIEFFTSKLPAKARKYLAIICQIAVSYFLIILSYYGFKILILQSRHSTEGLNIPNHFFSMPVVIGAVILLMISIRKLLAIIMGIDRTVGG
jgi:TRAP-type C4-dicarboxylate transport system permease small subunit